MLRICTCLIFMAGLSAADWPQWRGPERTGVATDSPALTASLPDTVPAAWSVDLPKAPRKPPYYGTPVGVGGKVYFHGTCIAADAPADAKKPPLEDFVICVSLADGSEVWQQRHPVGSGSKLGSPNVPVIADGVLYALANNSMLRAFDAATGAVQWETDLKLNKRGIAGTSSSILHDGTIIVQDDVGVAVGSDGAIKWKTEKLGVSHGSPAIWQRGGGPVALLQGKKAFLAVEIASGKTLWTATPVAGCVSLAVVGNTLVRLAEKSGEHIGGITVATLTDGGLTDERSVDFVCNGGGHNASTPAVRDGKIFCQGREEVLCINAADAAVVWRVKAKGDAKPSPILAGDVLLTGGKKPGLVMWNVADGSIVAKGKLPAKMAGCSSFALIDGRLVFQSVSKLVCLDLR